MSSTEPELFPKVALLEEVCSDVFTKSRNVLITAVENDTPPETLQEATSAAVQAAGVAAAFLLARQDDPIFEPACDAREDMLRIVAEITTRASLPNSEGETGMRKRLVPFMGQLNSLFGSVIAAVRERETEATFPKNARIPVLVITGFLGSGKTTLLNYILSEPHGKRIAVVENEFGEIGIDDKLLKANKVKTDEDIVETMNGCICCTVRADLVDVLNRLLEKKNKFDYVIIETTGMADPGPVAQTFFADPKLGLQLRLDGIVTLVDAFHVKQHLDEVKPGGEVNESVAQVGFADRILLNKIDLCTPQQLDEVESTIRSINATAAIFRTDHSRVNLDHLLDLRAFDLARIMSVDADFLKMKQHEDSSDDDHDHHDHHDAAACPDPEHHAHHDHEAADCHDPGHHHPHHSVKHGSGVGSLSFFFDGWYMDMRLLNQWFSSFLKAHGNDVYRMKGVVAIQGMAEKFVFQGVHMIFDGAPLEPWGDEKPSCMLVFIGKNLDKALIQSELEACLSSSVASSS